MSSGVEDTKDLDAATHHAARHTAQPTAVKPAGHHRPGLIHEHGHEHEHHVLLEPQEDRWRWRRKIRQNPRQLACYRFGVALAGLLFICLGVITGPLPGPGGIPLVLLGLAIWASEFEWANKLMQRFKAQLHRYRAWPRRRKVIFWLGFFAVCAAAGYGYLLVIGPPPWTPEVVRSALHRLPGV